MTTSYDLLRDKCNELLARQGEIAIGDVLWAIGDMFYIIDAWGNFYHLKMKLSDKAPMKGETICKFNLSAPLSDPSNAPACEAVLKLLDSEKV